MNSLYYCGLRQMEEKYLLKRDKAIIEDPQQHFMSIAITLVHTDASIYKEGKTLEFQKEALYNYYRKTACGGINNPTPFSVGIRTPNRQYDSCTLYAIDDKNNSIDVGMMVAQKATVAGAGVGVSLGRIRAAGTTFRNNGKHAGIKGYLGQLSKTIKGSNQASRGGSATVNLPVWHRDFYDLIMLKDVSGGIEGENRFRHLDYCFHYSEYLLDKLYDNEKILLISPHEKLENGKTVFETFYNVDENGMYDDKAYQEFEKKALEDPNLLHINLTNSTTCPAGVRVYTTAYELFSTLASQILGTGRIYTFHLNNVNDHSSFLEIVEMTNLCVEILQPVVPVYLEYDSKTNAFTPDHNSETSFCQLGGINAGVVKIEELPSYCYWIARFQEAVFHLNENSIIPFSHKQKARKNIGIGLTNFQYYLVQHVYSKYPSHLWIKEAGRETHKYLEAMQYYLLTASVALAKEFGKPCDYFHKTKYAKGILPIDTYKKTPLTEFPLEQDWESLRKDILTYGLNFSTHTAGMPVESSSVTFSSVNAIEFPRQVVTYKGNKQLTVAVTVPEVEKYGHHYVYAWDNKPVDKNALMLSIGANCIKFYDQGLSYNHYMDLSKGKIDELTLFRILFINPANAGLPTTYYCNSNTDVKLDTENDNYNTSEEMTEEDRQFYEQLAALEQESGCASGACSL